MDALQNTMATALAKLPGENREIRLKPWLFRVARNECIDSLNARRDQVSPEGLELASGSRVESEVADRERLRELLSDIGRLPEAQRSALVMRELSGLSFEDIGVAMDCSPAAARQSVYEARLSLRELESGRTMLCDEVRKAISARDGRVMRGRRLRAHLRSCDDCEGFRLAVQGRQKDLRSLVPALPAAAAASILGALGGGGSGLGGGLLAIFGGGGAAAGAGTKAVAIIAVTAGIGAGTAGVVNQIHSAGDERGSTVVSEQDPAGGSWSAMGSSVPANTAELGTGDRLSFDRDGSVRGGSINDPESPKLNDPGREGAEAPGQPGEGSGPTIGGPPVTQPGPEAGSQGGGRGRSEQAPGRAEAGPPGQGSGRPEGVGGGSAGAVTTGPPGHSQGSPASGGGPPASKPPPNTGVPGNSSTGPPASAGGGKTPVAGGNGKSAGTP